MNDLHLARPEKAQKARRAWLRIALAVLAAGILVLDLNTPKGVSESELYVIVVMMALALPRREIIAIMSACAALTVVGLLLSPGGSPSWLAVANRSLSLAVITAAGVLGLRLKSARDRLRDSERRLRLALDAANDGAWDWNVETGTVLFSDRWCTFLGFEPAAVEQRVEFWLSRIHPDDRDGVQATIRAHLRNKTDSFEHEHRLQRADGTWVWTLGRGKVVARNAAGKALRMVGAWSAHIRI